MFSSPDIIVGLEIGTSKVCAVVGEATAEGTVNIVGVGQSRSRGVRKGEICEPALAEEDVRNAIADAEKSANAEVRSVYLGVSGGHIECLNNSGFHPIPSVDREIDDDDVETVQRNAKAINLPRDHEVLHTIAQNYRVDGQNGIKNPSGFFGSRLEVDVHVVHGNTNRLQHPIRLVRGLQLEVEAVIFNGLAAAAALLSTEQKEQGALVIDLGAGTTEYVVYAGGLIRHTGALALGGDHVSNDLAYGLKLPLARAEALKLEFGGAFMDASVRGQTHTIQSEPGLPEKTVNLEHLRRIMALRVEEIFQVIDRDLACHDLHDHLRGGVYLCGGGAHIPQIERLARQVFGLDETTVAHSTALGGLKSALDMPEFATAVGLVKCGFLEERMRGGRVSLFGRLRSAVSGMFGML